MKKVLVGCGGFVVLVVVLSWAFSDDLKKLFSMSTVHGAGSVLRLVDGGTTAPPELPVFVDPRDGGR
jgi:hypothetical protein